MDQHRKQLANALYDHESWLVHRILYYAQKTHYTQYTSTLPEAWYLSIRGLTDSLVRGFEAHEQIPEIYPHEDMTTDPLAAFGILEAQKHRQRGISLDMFLGLMKYYCITYHDFLNYLPEIIPGFQPQYFHQFIGQCFNRIELGFVKEWTSNNAEQLILELQAQNRLITNEKNLFLTLFESIPKPALVFDKNLNLVAVNSLAAHIFFHLERPGAYYYNNTNINQTQLHLIQEELQDFVKNDKMTKSSFRKSIENSTYDITFARFCDVSQQFNYIATLFDDVTYRLDMEKRNLELQQEIFGRLKMQALTDLVLGFSHQINNPLTILWVGSRVFKKQILKNQNLEKETVLQFLNEQEGHFKRISDLISQLDVFKNTDPKEIVRFDIHAIINRLAAVCEKMAQRPLEFTFEFLAKKSTLEGNQSDFTHMLYNILLNSLKAISGHPAPSISVTTFNIEDHITIKINDNGHGIEPDKLNRVFDLFYTTDMNLAKNQSSGLGLSYVYNIVKRFNGQVKIDSIFGESTTVTITVPLNLEAG